MATELTSVGPGMPVVHQAHHDLESFFYILLAICLLYDEPGKRKPAKELALCFDPFFSVSQPSTLKVVTIQSDFGWTWHMVPYISSYFDPLIPLLEKIREELILPIRLQGGNHQANRHFTHDNFIDAIVIVLAKLPEDYWVPKTSKTREVVQRGLRGLRGSASTASSMSATATSAVVLPDIPLPWLTTMRSSSKRLLENEDGSSSQVRKRQTRSNSESLGVSGLDSTSWGDLDVLDRL